MSKFKINVSDKPFYGYMFVFDMTQTESFTRVLELLKEMSKKEKDRRNSKNFISPKKIFVGTKMGEIG